MALVALTPDDTRSLAILQPLQCQFPSVSLNKLLMFLSSQREIKHVSSKFSHVRIHGRHDKLSNFFVCLELYYINKTLYTVFYVNFTWHPSAHFEKIWTSNTHNSYMITEFFYQSEAWFYPSGTGGWVFSWNTGIYFVGYVVGMYKCVHTQMC